LDASSIGFLRAGVFSTTLLSLRAPRFMWNFPHRCRTDTWRGRVSGAQCTRSLMPSARDWFPRAAGRRASRVFPAAPTTNARLR
jgi:hypothetical protein